MRFNKLSFLGGMLFLAGCQQQDGTPPVLSIVTPTNDVMVSGNSAVQVTVESNSDEPVEVRLYARKRGSGELGVALGSVSSAPYVYSWNTTEFPSGNDLEIYAKATQGGVSGDSQPVRVNIQNASSPELLYMVAYNLPKSLQSQSLIFEGGDIPPHVDPAKIVQEHKIGLQGVLSPAADQNPLPSSDRSLAVEWAWKPVDGALGYRILRSDTSVAGPYTAVKDQAASTGAAAQEKFSQYLPEAFVGQKVYGTVRSLKSGQTTSALSRVGQAVFLNTQQVASPAAGQNISDGRPILTWNALQGASGYLYFLCDRPCTEKDSKFVWTNYPVNTTSFSAAYPADKEPLKSGTYYWWVAGVRMENGKAVSLSYSEQRQLVVP